MSRHSSTIFLAPAAFLGAASFFAAAAPAQPPSPSEGGEPAPASLLEEIEAGRALPGSYRGTATLRAYGDAEGMFGAAFARAQPDRGRLEMTTPLTGTALVVTAASGELLAYYPLEEIAVVVPDDARDVPAFVAAAGGGLAESLDLLAGRPPLYVEEVAAGTLKLDVREDGDGLTLTWRGAGGARVQQLTLAGEGRRPLGFRIFEDDAAAVDVAYGDWRDAGGVEVPFAVTVKTADAVVEVALKKFEIDVDVPEGAFSTTPPAGVEVLEGWPEAVPPKADDGGS
jgi:hypothetical protein